MVHVLGGASRPDGRPVRRAPRHARPPAPVVVRPAVPDAARPLRLAAHATGWADAGAAMPLLRRAAVLGRTAGYALGGLVVLVLTGALDGPAAAAGSWDAPAVVPVLVVWTLLWSLLGLGRGVAPGALTGRPAVAGLSYWLTPGTVRLPAAPRLPGARGTTRGVVDVALYGLVLAVAAGLLGVTGLGEGSLPRAGVAVLLVALGALTLRDRTPLLAVHPELLVPALAVLLLPADDRLVALRWVLAAGVLLTGVLRTHRGAAAHLATTLAAAPLPAGVRAFAFERDGGRRRPSGLASGLAALVALGGWVGGPLVLLAGDTRLAGLVVAVGTAGAVLAVLALPRTGAPERAVLTAVLLAVLVGRHAGDGVVLASGAVATAVLAAVLLAGVVLAAARPRATAVLAASRHRAGNGPLSVWFFRPDAAARVGVVAAPGDEADLGVLTLLPAGTALVALAGRALPDPEAAVAHPGGTVGAVSTGWALGGGRGADHLLLEALRDRCGLAEGDLRVVAVDPQRLGAADLRYRVLDAATGRVEAGGVELDDLLEPRDGGACPTAVPVDVTHSSAGLRGYVSPFDIDRLLGRALPLAPGPRPRPRPGARPRPAARPRPQREDAA